MDMDIQSMDIHRKSVDMDMDMDVKFHIHGNPVYFTATTVLYIHNYLIIIAIAFTKYHACNLHLFASFYTFYWSITSYCLVFPRGWNNWYCS